MGVEIKLNDTGVLLKGTEVIVKNLTFITYSP